MFLLDKKNRQGNRHIKKAISESISELY
jgi:hypothetical protein